MWEGLFTLLIFCLVMAVSSFLAGLVPITLSLSHTNFRLISALGSGLLVGTCLIIIIPEGVETTYSAAEHYYEKQQEGGYDYPGKVYEPHGWIGVSLIAGFILMYLIDQLPHHAAKFSHSRKAVHVSLANLSQIPNTASSSQLLDEEASPSFKRSLFAPSQGTAATIGLVIHAIADGIALAASTFIAHSRTGLIVFFALMIHKAPAAFGLTAILMKKGLTKNQARTHLIFFSLAAPFGALFTWLFVNLVIGPGLGQVSTRFATGMLLMFSGGTFLFVAMHHGGSGGRHEGHEAVSELEANGPEYSQGHARRSEAGAHTFMETAITVTGMLLPLVAEIGHVH